MSRGHATATVKDFAKMVVYLSFFIFLKFTNTYFYPLLALEIYLNLDKIIKKCMSRIYLVMPYPLPHGLLKDFVYIDLKVFSS